MSKTVFGVFNNLKDAEKALGDLKKQGYDKGRAGILSQGLEDTQMQIPKSKGQDAVAKSGNVYPDKALQNKDYIADDIQSSLSGGAMTSPAISSGDVANGENAGKLDDSGLKYADVPVVSGSFFTDATNRHAAFHPTYDEYDNRPKNDKYFQPEVRDDNENTKRLSSSAVHRHFNRAYDTLNPPKDEFLVVARAESDHETKEILSCLERCQAKDTEVFDQNGE